MNKITKLFKAVKVYKNWYSFVLHKYFPALGDWVLKTRDGCKIRIRGDEEADAYVASESWLYELHKELIPYLKDAKVGIDVGAHIGTFTLWASRRTRAKIYAFEPAGKNLKTLRENIALNHLEDRVEVRPYIVSSENGEKDFYIAKNAGMNSTRKDWTELRKDAGGLEKIVKIKAVSLSDFISSLTACDFIKIDIEGGEYELLTNLSDEAYAKIRAMSIEISSRVDELVNYIESKGFRCVRREGNHIFVK